MSTVPVPRGTPVTGDASAASDTCTGLESPQRDLGIDGAHFARVYDYLLGGKNQYEPDRRTARALTAVVPNIATMARANRAFAVRATTVLAQELAIRQWLEIGAGFPYGPNVHEVAQRVAAEARVVYVDNDPIVLTHLRALLSSGQRGRISFVQADATDPPSVLSTAELTDTLDLSQPVALSITGLLPLITDDRVAYGMVRCLLDALPSGSVLVLTHCTADFAPEAWQEAAEICRAAGIAFRPRTREEVERFFTGLTLLDPGIGIGDRWRPPKGEASGHRMVSDADVSLWAGVGLKTCSMLPRSPLASSQTAPGRPTPQAPPNLKGPGPAHPPLRSRTVMSDLSASAMPTRRHRGRRARPRAIAAAGDAPQWMLAMLPLLTVGAASFAAWLAWTTTVVGTARTWTVFAVVVLVVGAATLLATRWAKAIGHTHRRLRRAERNASEHIRRVEHWIYGDLWPLLQHGREALQLQPAPHAAQPPEDGTQSNPYTEFAAALDAFVTEAQSAVGQAARRDHSDVTMYVTKRLHSTVLLALKKIYQLVRKTEDPETMDIVFEVDQLATQMRRSIESLAILGGERPRRQEKTSLVSTVLRSAVSEVRNQGRVRRIPLRDSAILGYAVPELVHLLAEMVENAVRYSPPGEEVMVKPSYVPKGLAIEIDDVGLPIEPQKLAALNRILDPAAPDLPEDRKITGLGMRVVAEIARRYDVDVHLDRNRKGGNQVLVIIPAKLIASAEPAEEPAVQPANPSLTETRPTAVRPAPAPVQWPAGPTAAPAPPPPAPSAQQLPRPTPHPKPRRGAQPRLPKRSESANRGPMPNTSITATAPPPPAREPGRIAAEFARALHGNRTDSRPTTAKTAQEDQT